MPHVHDRHRVLHFRDYIFHLTWSPDGAYLASLERGHVLRVWDMRNAGRSTFRRRNLSVYPNILLWSDTSPTIRLFHTDYATAHAMVDEFEPHGKDLKHTVHRALVRVEIVYMYGSYHERFSEDASHYLVHISGAIKFYQMDPADLESGGRLVSEAPLPQKYRFVVSSAWSPTCAYVATFARDWTLRIFSVSSGKVVALKHLKIDVATVKQIGTDFPHRVVDSYPRRRSRNIVVSLEWSPDGRHVACVTSSALYLFRFDDGAGTLTIESKHFLENVLSEKNPRSVGLSWSPCGHYVAVGATETGDLWFVHVASGNVVCRYRTGHPGRVDRVRWSPDGRRLATTCVCANNVLILDTRYVDDQFGRRMCQIVEYTLRRYLDRDTLSVVLAFMQLSTDVKF